MSKIEIDVILSNKKSRLISMKHEPIDGSVYLVFLHEKGTTSGTSCNLSNSLELLSEIEQVSNVDKRVKVSYHTSGIIKYEQLSNSRVTGEPLFDIVTPFLFIEYWVKDLDLLLEANDEKETLDIVLPDKKSTQYYKFSLVISPTPLENTIYVDFCSGLFYICILVDISEDMESGNGMPFYYLTPSHGLSKTTPQTNSCILYHQKLTGSDECIVYKANQSGIYTMIFANERRNIPRKTSLINFYNSEYEAEFISIRNYYAKFKVKEKKSGHLVIKDENLIKSIVFDNRIYPT